MADELERFLEEQKAKLAQDKIKLDQDPPYMEMRTNSSEPSSKTNQTVDSIAKGNVLAEENYGLSLPLGLEYDLKKQKLKEELRQDYRRYMAEKNSRTTKDQVFKVERLSLPISDRKSAKDRLRTERNKEYNQFLREQDKYERLRRNDRWLPKYYKENIDPSDDTSFQNTTQKRTGALNLASHRQDAYTSMEAYEELLNQKRQEEDRYRKSDDPEIGQRRNVQTQTDRGSEAYENNFANSGNHFQRSKNESSYYKERRDQKPTAYVDDGYKEDDRKRPVSAAGKSRYLINNVYNSPKLRSKSASVKDDVMFATGLLVGNYERESAQRRRREKYRQELLEQISEKQKNKIREKELELRVAASGAVDPEKEPNRIREFGAVTLQHDTHRHDTSNKESEVPFAKYSSDERSSVDERRPPEHPRVAFQNPPFEDRVPNSGLSGGIWNPYRNITVPSITTIPPPPPAPVLMEHYQTPYDNAYYFYGARNPLDPNLAYYSPGVIGVQPMSLVNSPTGLTNIPMQVYPQVSSFDQVFTTNAHDATNVRSIAAGSLGEQKNILSKESTESYQDSLKKQMQEREERKRKEKEEKEKYDAKLEEEMRIYNPWGRGGGGAPLRDAEGNLLTDLKKMHKQNEDAYRDYPPQGNQDSKAVGSRNPNLTRPDANAPQEKIQGFTLANTAQLSHGNPVCELEFEKKVNEQQKYKEYLRLQIEEKRRKAEEERERCKLEEQQEEKRLAEQRARIAKELEEEQEKKRRKEEEQRIKNEEIARLAEERRKIAEKKRKEEEDKQEMMVRQLLKSEQSTRIEEKVSIFQRPPSPPIPTVKKQIDIQKNDMPAVSGSPQELNLDHPQSGTESPPVPARRNQLRAFEEKKDIISELSVLRRQLRSEERRLEGHFQNADKEEDTAFSLPKKRDRNHVDVFDLARQRIQALVHRPSSKERDFVNLQNIRDFNDLKYRDSATRAEIRQVYPDPPNDSNTLEIQQEALLREQKKKLDTMKRKETVARMNPHDIGPDSHDDLVKNSLLESESAFLGSHGETFPFPVGVGTTTSELPPRERRRQNNSRLDLDSVIQPVPQPDTISVRSASSFNVDQVRARNEQRMKRLDDIQRSGNDLTMENVDILNQFLSRDQERPSSDETVATEAWLRPGTSETLKRFMADRTQFY
ncbi:centrosome and spindle pole-associated protein 1-like isoform X3 [Stegostoma tigrinum]|uniref:centrosome and spindle pole-associated protein 1-like isoform X3 n=1 Tax=Stegostoma tigrinum TaxID=3053191 RepID=UPI00202B15E5|nr:centrosome and spindle pole-associated protein 1-like isoform X3 [Stegostoma tigrinum]